MTTEQEKLFEDKFKDSLEKARIQGMSIGLKTVSKVIYDKIKTCDRTNTKNDLLRAIKEVKTFCETGLAIKDSNTKAE